MTEAVILGAVRTAVGKFGGALRSFPATRLGALLISDLLARSSIPFEEVDELIMGNVLSAGLGQNPARQVAIHAGLPMHVSSYSVNQVCASGLKAVMLAAQAIKAGDAELVVAGGMESMSNAPYLLKNARWGMKHGNDVVVDSMVYDGLWDAFNDFHMGMTGERIAEKFGITRQEADEFACRSHMRALEATVKGSFGTEIVPIAIKENAELFQRDEGIREDTSIEKLSKLKPVFKQDGIVTAGNSSQLSDGAASLVVSSIEKADELGVRPIAQILGFATSGVKPEDIMEAPIHATKRLLEAKRYSVDEIALFEHNEAFATASVAVSRALDVDDNRFNVNGGAVALGHPIGCSGSRILVTLIHALIEKGGRVGVATLCLGGGNGVCMIVERC